MTQSAPLSRIDRIRAALGSEYEVLRTLGDGGMASVYLARERALKRLVAIKVLDPDLGVSPIFRTRFEREAETAGQIQHPNIVPIHRVGYADGLAYFTMAYIAGDSLGDRMRAIGAMPVAMALRYTREIAEALAAAHRRGVIHRDVKPQNVLIDADTGRAMVTDFGIASVADAADLADHSSAAGEPLTHQGMVMGTPRYMSPEQCSGQRDLTPASDLYALGVMLYEMLSGAYPYKVAEPPNYMLAHLTREPIPLVTRIGDLPRDVDRLVQRLLAKEPGDRYASADALITAIDALSSESPIAESPDRLRKRTWGTRVGAVALGIAAIATAIVGVRTRLRAATAGAVDPRRSLLIGFFENNTPDRRLDWLRIGGVEYLSQSLGRWKDLRLVGAEQLLDLARRESIAEDQPLSQDDALRLGRRAKVGTTTIGSILKFGDTLRVTVRVYDVASGTLLRTATAESASDSTLPQAFTSLATQLLDLAGAPLATLGNTDPPTSSITGYRAYVEGVAARSRWDLKGAANAFEQAVKADSTFALAYYELSQAKFALASGITDTSYAALADEAVRWAENRPTKERLLLQAYRAYVRADLPVARDLYERLLAIDSTETDALAGLADVQVLDRTLRPNGRGGWVMPSDLTSALHNYERALAINASDHRSYANLVELLNLAAFGQAEAIPAYRDPPQGHVVSALFLRPPTKWYSAVLRRDSFSLVPADSIGSRFSKATLDSLRAAARARSMAVVRQWTSIAPNEGQPYAIEAQLLVLDHDYDGGLVALATAERLGATSNIPFAMIRLSYLLDAQRLPAAIALADSLRSGSVATVPSVGSLLGQRVLVSGLMAAGRARDAMVLGTAVTQSLRLAGASSTLQQRFDVGDITTPLRVSAVTGEATRATVRDATARLEQLAGSAADADRASIRKAAARSVVFAAAAVGDTAMVREWNRYVDFDYSPEIAAWAAVNAGDTPRAGRLLSAIAVDTTHVPSAIYARAKVLLALGKRPEAIKAFARLDSAEFRQGPVVNTDWVLRVRSIAERGAVFESMGDTASARRDYLAFISLWKGADAPLAVERDRVAKALRDLALPGRRDRGAE